MTGTVIGAVLDRRRALLYALLIGLAVMWLTGAIPRWGQWYSEQPYYRAQAHALLDGRLALSHDVASLGLDLAWVDGSVQQVWGLGVPLWLAVWEVIGRAIHLTPFPDRLAMLFGVVLTLYALLRAWLGPGGDRSYGSRGAFLFTALLPGVVTMLRGRVVVYEEAAAYAYGAAMLLVAGVIMMIRRPSTARYVLLLAFAGATGLVRPTVWFYGAATAAVATALYVRHRGSWRRALGPVALAGGGFLAGGGALYLTNDLRFGDGAEFGHRLNLADVPGNTYATRFGHPFETVPAATAAKELVGAMFSRPELAVHRELYDRRIHPWQADLPRFREHYFTTYTWGYAPLWLAGLILAALAWWRARRRAEPARRPGPDLDRDSRWLGAWAVLGGVPLVVFYLHSPSLSSRYLLDLAPMIAVLIATAWRYAAAALGRVRLGPLAFAGFVAWWAVSLLGSRSHRSWLPPVGATAAYASMMRVADPSPGARLIPPGAYDLADPWLEAYLGDQWLCRCYADLDGEQACDHRGFAEPAGVERTGSRPRVLERRLDGEAPAICAGVPRAAVCSPDDPAAPSDPPPEPRVETWSVPAALYGNGTQWDIATGAVGVATYFFVDDPAYVEVEVAWNASRPAGAAGAVPGDRASRPAGRELVPAVRAAVQLEELPLVAAASTARGVRLRFAGPRTPSYRRGLQLVFLGFGPPERIDQVTSEYTLLRVAWRDHPEAGP